MLPRLAEAVESLFGGRLAPVAAFARGAASVTLALAIALPLLRAALSFTAFRYGWETALVVRCPRCRRLVADPDVGICPAGHPIRFPPGAARRESPPAALPPPREGCGVLPLRAPGRDRPRRRRGIPGMRRIEGRGFARDAHRGDRLSLLRRRARPGGSGGLAETARRTGTRASRGDGGGVPPPGDRARSLRPGI